MVTCLYCAKEKPESELTLEHVIPQFLGGASAPDRFKIRRVCRSCNSTLGLFVDAAYAKSWWISNWLAMTAISCFDVARPSGIPLVCMGPTRMKPPEMSDDEVCELWLGPHGEQVFWIRPIDERLYWYVGGNPVTAKTIDSRAYFLFSIRSAENQQMTWLSFKDAFNDRAVRKIMCTTVVGADPVDIGFSAPDALDQRRIDYFKTASPGDGIDRQVSLAINVAFDHRFMAKLGLGIGYVLFGDEFLATKYCAELRSGLWHRANGPAPAVHGIPTLGPEKEPAFLKFSGLRNAVTLILMPLPEGLALNLNVGEQHSATVLCAERAVLNLENLDGLTDGLAMVLYPHLRQCISLPLPRFLAHKLGHLPHAELTAAAADACRNRRAIERDTAQDG